MHVSLLHPNHTDPQSAFQRTMVNNILVRSGENGTIPCLVTDPAVSLLALETCDGQPLPPGMRYHGDRQHGVVIGKVRKEYEGCYVCVGRLDGAAVKSDRYTLDVRLGKLKGRSVCVGRGGPQV